MAGIDLFSVEGRVAIVTGASSGIGARMARALAAAGARVAIAGRRADRLQKLAEEIGGLAVPTDMTELDQVRRLVEATTARWDRLDVMVNNAGVTNITPAAKESDEEFARVVATNLEAVFTGCREAARVMLAQPTGGGIVNVASALGLKASWKIPQASYVASKGGAVNLTRELAAQWARRGVRVNAICPGWFPSEMTEAMFGDERSMRFNEARCRWGGRGRRTSSTASCFSWPQTPAAT